MEYDKNIRMWSLLGQRGTFGFVLREMAKENMDIYALTADLCKTSGLDKFCQEFPDRFVNAGIAEQNMVGMAAGLADKGKNPFVTTFANFAVLRANEFVRHFMAYMNCNVKLIGIGSGYAMEFFGNTHYGIEDIAVIRAMPNIVILSPADCTETAKCVEFCAGYKGPVYLRLTGKMNNPIVYRKDYNFKMGKGIVLRDGKDIAIFSTGSMVNVALKTSELLQERKLSVKVIDIHTIKPLDKEMILQHKDYRLLVTMEEHSTIGGLGSAVAEILAASPMDGRLLNLGIGQKYLKAGNYDYMLEQNRLTPMLAAEDIWNAIEM